MVTEGVDSGLVFNYRMKVTVNRSRLVGSEVGKNGASIAGELTPGEQLNLSLIPRDGEGVHISGFVTPFGGCAETPPAQGPLQGPGQTDSGTLTIIRTDEIGSR